MSRPLSLLVPALALVTVISPGRAEKPQKWLEVRSPHFIVVSNGNEKQARRVADQFERIRSVFHTAFPHMRLDPRAPIVVLATRDEKSFNTLLPEAWLQKGALKRAGMFLRQPEKNYVALRLDAGGDHAYQVVYHEYTHLLIEQNSQSVTMPLWLNEGLAEFYGNSEIHEKEVWLGQPSRSHVLLLREAKLLPFQSLFAIDYSSPYYNEDNKGSIFYAESWVLVHYLMVKARQEGTNPLAEFLKLLRQQVNETEAASRAFGDLPKLRKELEGYVRQSSFHYVQMKASTEVDEEDFKVRELSPVEVGVVQADFLVHNQRYSEARGLLGEAIRQEPNYTPAYESLGLLEFRQGHLEEAKKRFGEAVKLDSRSYLAHYYYAVMTIQETQSVASAEQVESSLRTAISINPEFAPAYQALATLYVMRGDHLDEAHTLALQAVQLEPDNVSYLVTVGSVLLRLKRADDAVIVGGRALGMAKSSADRAAVQSFLDGARQYQGLVAAQLEAEKRARIAEQEFEARRAEEEKASQQQPQTVSGATPAEPPPEPMVTPEPTQASAEGVVIQLGCASPASMKLTLSLPLYKIELHARNYHRVRFSGANGKLPSPFDPCHSIKGVRARVVYSIGQQDAGEIISVELRK